MSKVSSTPKTATRSCIACGKSCSKSSFVRFVRSKDGVVNCDSSGKAAGRGAYLCANEECFEIAEKRNRFAAALRCTLSKEDYRRLEDTFRDICAQQERML